MSMRPRNRADLIGGSILVGIGVLAQLQTLGVPAFWLLSRFWPIVLIALGVAWLRGQRSAGREAEGRRPGDGEQRP